MNRKSKAICSRKLVAWLGWCNHLLDYRVLLVLSLREGCCGDGGGGGKVCLSRPPMTFVIYMETSSGWWWCKLMNAFPLLITNRWTDWVINRGRGGCWMMMMLIMITIITIMGCANIWTTLVAQMFACLFVCSRHPPNYHFRRRHRPPSPWWWSGGGGWECLYYCL